jgi:hypothetical protein
LIDNGEADSALRLAAARQAVKERNQAAYPSILRFFTQMSAGTTAESYTRIITPLVKLYSSTGISGLVLAIEAFERNELGPQGPHLLASFRSEFGAWFLAQPPRPSIKWARVLLLAWRRADSSVERNNLLSLLIDDWCSKSFIADFVRGKLQQNLRNDGKYLAPAERHVQARVREFAKLNSGETRKDFQERVLAVLQVIEVGWEVRRIKIPHDRVTGIAAATAFVTTTDDVKNRIISWVEKQTRYFRFQRGFFKRLTKPDDFKQFSHTIQLRLIKSAAFINNVTSKELELLLSCGSAHSAEVLCALKDALVSILRQSHMDILIDDRSF